MANYCRIPATATAMIATLLFALGRGRRDLGRSFDCVFAYAYGMGSIFKVVLSD